MRNKTLLMGVIGAVVIGLLLSAGVLLAGSLNPSAGPTGAASQMFTLQQIYDRLNSGAAGTKMTTFTEPSSGPGTGTMQTLDEVMTKAPAADQANGASAAQVLTGKTFWGLRSQGNNSWGPQTGSMPVQTLSDANVTVAAGYYAATTLSAVDTDLATGNIKSGVTLFGVAGTLSAGSTSGLPKTGQTTSYATGDDGDLEKGVAWPNPRFTDNNNNGTVTDNLTGLIWLKNANCAGAGRNWASAVADVASLNSGGKMNTNVCGDTSRDPGNGAAPTHQTDWRLPNVREMHSLIDYGPFAPALPSGPFTGVLSDLYWTSTTYAVGTTSAFLVNMGDGTVPVREKTTFFYYVWPVRGGQ